MRVPMVISVTNFWCVNQQRRCYNVVLPEQNYLLRLSHGVKQFLSLARWYKLNTMYFFRELQSLYVSMKRKHDRWKYGTISGKKKPWQNQRDTLTPRGCDVRYLDGCVIQKLFDVWEEVGAVGARVTADECLWMKRQRLSHKMIHLVTVSSNAAIYRNIHTAVVRKCVHKPLLCSQFLDNVSLTLILSVECR